MTGTPARHTRRALAGRLLLLSVAAYLAGVGIAAAFGRPAPWVSGIVALGPVLGGVAGGALARRSRGTS
ncbi:hypothetical protein [Amycolatopsis kentuckyensis]|uniref:hypothetical protein n=1 Tax=Amycolatopsis kentuckyensis TaxID=218823 RepID=UPI000A397F07|nr:hypothetical protein [Amycolatopsis kentuckyensis]